MLCLFLISAKRVLSLALISKPLSLPTSKPLILSSGSPFAVKIKTGIFLNFLLRNFKNQTKVIFTNKANFVMGSCI